MPFNLRYLFHGNTDLESSLKRAAVHSLRVKPIQSTAGGFMGGGRQCCGLRCRQQFLWPRKLRTIK